VATRPGTVDDELARQLANGATRQEAVAAIEASPGSKVTLLLIWAGKPPARVDEHELYVGLADAFGRLKTKEAIPFLIKNITLARWPYVSLAPWLKTSEVIEETYPAMEALIRIGPDASRAVMRAAQAPMAPGDRRAAIFVVSHIMDVPEARTFLSSALSEADRERYWAEEGLKMLDVGRSPTR